MKYLTLALLILTFSAPSFAEDDAIKEMAKEILRVKQDDIVYGNSDAPVTVIEYASLSCGHCANFYKNIFPEIHKNYVETGKITFVFRHFPLNKPAADAAKLVECQDSNERKQRFLKTLFKLQDRWAFTEEYLGQLEKIARTGGMHQDEFNACISNTELEKRVLSQRLDAGKVLKVQSTPSILVNGELVQVHDAKSLSDAIDAALN